MESMVPLSNSFIWLNAADFQILYSIMTIKTSIHISLHSFAVPYPRVARHRVVHGTAPTAQSLGQLPRGGPYNLEGASASGD